jgi:hypothetical protein
MMTINGLLYIEANINACCCKDTITNVYLPKIQALLPKGSLPNNEADIHLQAKAIQVQEVANERIALLENRQNLYQ